ncbi:MAG: hypothetical protein E7Z75_09795 [Methanobrevibacter olleyae]|uniref:Uncharacterized protein n=1 Tax=Methanobrevibacter olleyae TaxID=294671 RepID=A0A8T3VVY1_METOL|nr:hypothetical protein [Methanobrevibacter olleyae]
MLKNTYENNIRITYKQNITINKVKTKTKTYEYKEVYIPVELLNYWTSITHEEVKTLGYIVSLYNGLKTSFITPLTMLPEDTNCLYDTDISRLHNSPEVVKPVRVIPIRVSKRGKKNSPDYFIRLNSKEFVTSQDFLEFVINPYLDDPILKVKGLVSIENLVIL